MKPITFNGETHSLAQWSKKLGISRQTLWARLNIFGYSIEKALSERVKPHNISIAKKSGMMEKAKNNNVSYSTLTSRLKLGWSVDDSISTPIRKYSKHKK